MHQYVNYKSFFVVSFFRIILYIFSPSTILDAINDIAVNQLTKIDTHNKKMDKNIIFNSIITYKLKWDFVTIYGMKHIRISCIIEFEIMHFFYFCPKGKCPCSFYSQYLSLIINLNRYLWHHISIDFIIFAQ